MKWKPDSSLEQYTQVDNWSDEPDRRPIGSSSFDCFGIFEDHHGGNQIALIPTDQLGEKRAWEIACLIAEMSKEPAFAAVLQSINTRAALDIEEIDRAADEYEFHNPEFKASEEAHEK